MISQVSSFSQLLDKSYDWYPDLVMPIRYFMTELVFGLKICVAAKNAKSVKRRVVLDNVEAPPLQEDELDLLEVQLRQSLTRSLSTGENQSTLELLRYISANWIKEQERLDAEKAEQEAAFKYKSVDLGDTVESQQEAEDAEFDEFFSTKNEFKSETEGPEKQASDPMEKWFSLANLFVSFGKKTFEDCLVENAKISLPNHCFRSFLTVSHLSEGSCSV